jgi:hypothetical protein
MTGSPPQDSIVAAHRHSSRHREELERGARCGCFYCLAIFPPAEIRVWIDDQSTAMCPRCSIDSVIGEASGFPIEREFLAAMRRHWF